MATSDPHRSSSWANRIIVGIATLAVMAGVLMVVGFLWLTWTFRDYSSGPGPGRADTVNAFALKTGCLSLPDAIVQEILTAIDGEVSAARRFSAVEVDKAWTDEVWAQESYVIVGQVLTLDGKLISLVLETAGSPNHPDAIFEITDADGITTFPVKEMTGFEFDSDRLRADACRRRGIVTPPDGSWLPVV